MITFLEFRNAVCILRSIDQDELVRAGVLPSGDFEAWATFSRNPFETMLRMDDAKTDALWALVMARMPKQ